jgi:hypothetical protein
MHTPCGGAADLGSHEDAQCEPLALTRRDCARILVRKACARSQNLPLRRDWRHALGAGKPSVDRAKAQGFNHTSRIGIDCGDTNPCPDAEHAAKVRAYNSVRRATPWFRVQQMIDAWYLYEKGMLDLTDGDGLIHSKANPSLCLDLGPVGGVQLSKCGVAERWTFNRGLDLVVPISGGAGALDAVSPLLGTPAALTLTNTGNSVISQWWTYDPEHDVLVNALGNALDVPVANPQSGQTVETFTSATLSGLAQDFNLGPGADGALYTRPISDGGYRGPIAVTAANFASADAAIAVGAQSATDRRVPHRQ